MNDLVIGGAGFIGSHLCAALLAQGDVVVAADDFSLGNEENVAAMADDKKFRLVKTDAANLAELKRVFADCKPDRVFHLAANSDIQKSAQNPMIEYKNTYSTTYFTLENMRKFGVKKIFFASTSAVYGNRADELLTESTADLRPISYYGAAKLGSEALISAFSYMNDFSSLIFRFPNVIGPNLTHGVIFDFVKRLRENPRELTILGNGKQTKPYIYVADLVDAIIKFCDTPSGVEIYNVGVEGATSVTAIAETVIAEMNLHDVKIIYTGGEGGWKGDVPRFSYDITKISDAGWRAKHTSDEAVRRTVREYLAANKR